MNEITLVVDYDEEIRFFYFVVKEGEETIHFRPGFRTREETERVGDAWIQKELGATRNQGDEDNLQ